MTRLTRQMRWLTPRVILSAMGVLAVLGTTAAVPAYRAAGKQRPVESVSAPAAKPVVAGAGRTDAARKSAEQVATLALETATRAGADRVAREAEVRAAADRVRASAAATAAAGRELGGAVGQAADRVARTGRSVPTDWVAGALAARARHAADTARRTGEAADRARASAAVVARDAGRLADRVGGLTDKARTAATEVAGSVVAAAGRTADARAEFVRAEAEAERVAATLAAEAEVERMVAALTEAAFQTQAPKSWPEAIATVWDDPNVSAQLKAHKAEAVRLGFKYDRNALAKDVKYDPATKALTWTVDAAPTTTDTAMRAPLLAVVTEVVERGLVGATDTAARTAILNGFRVIIRPATMDIPPPEVPCIPCPPSSCAPCDPCAVTSCRPARTRCCGGLKPTLRCR